MKKTPSGGTEIQCGPRGDFWETESKHRKCFGKVNKCHKMKIEIMFLNKGSWYIGNSFRLVQCAPTSNTFCVWTCAGSFSKESCTFFPLPHHFA